MTRGPTTAKERDDVRQLALDELAKEENQDFPEMATVTLHATGVLTLLDEYDALQKLSHDLRAGLLKVYLDSNAAWRELMKRGKR